MNKRKSWIIALWLSVVFGWAGLDSFYLGKPVRGTVKLLTVGLFGILWLIDIIAILTRSVSKIDWR